MLQTLSSRLPLALIITAVLLLTGCATQSAHDPDNYGTRSSDVEAIDNTIAKEVERALERTDGRLAQARIKANVFNGEVLLVGQVPSEELKSTATQVAEDIRGVSKVHNELAIAATIPATQRLTDSWITTNVVSQMATNNRIDSSKIEVTTENASVYLMGIVARSEAEMIVNEVSTVRGVQRIVKVFDYLD
ncbi:BON domain-containing protein [Halomonas sp. BLK-85]